MLRVPKWAVAALAAAAASLLAAYWEEASAPSSQAPPAAPAAANDPAPASRPPLRSAGLEEVRKEIAAHRGAPLLVNFWAVWCQPCVEELPDLAALESRQSASGLRVLGVNLDLVLEDDSKDLRSRVGSVLAKAGASFQNLLYSDSQDSLVEGFDLPGPLPHSILYDSGGRIVRRWTGRLPLAEFEAALPRKK